MITPTAEKDLCAVNQLVVPRLSQASHLQHIREQARNVWSAKGDTSTTYRENYQDHLASVHGRPQVRSGTTIRNRPHPPT